MWEQMPSRGALIKKAGGTSREGNMLPNCHAASPLPLSLSAFRKGKQPSGGSARRWQAECPPRWDILSSLLCAGHSLPPPLFAHFLFFIFPVVAERLLLLLILRMCTGTSCQKTSAVNIVTNKATNCFSNSWPFALGNDQGCPGLSEKGHVVCLHWRTVRAINTLHRWSSTLGSNWIKLRARRSQQWCAGQMKINVLICKFLTRDTSPG